MNWKKFLLIGVAVGAFAFAAAPRAEARISVGIGFGFPVGYGYYDHGYPAYYPYASDYYGYRPRYYARPVVYVGPRYYRYHGNRIYYPRRHHRHWR